MASRKRVRKTCAIGDSGSLYPVNVVRRRSGKLTLLPDLPYDIVVEILGHLHPYDLLRLTRTSKDWRRSLMSRSSESIWRLSRSRLDMPDCPSDMSEPEYANLMFSTHCHYCLAPRVQPIIWTTRCRACKACFPIYYTRSLTVRWKREHYNLPLQAWKFAELHGNIVRSSTYAPITSRDKFRNIISLELLEDITEEFKQVKDEPDSSIQHWLKKREEEYEHETHIIGALEQWHELQRQRRSQEIESIREKRKDMIVQKLEEIGWKEEITAMDIDRLRSQAKVHVARELTETAWMTMAPALIQFMEGVKAERLQKFHDEQISSRRQLFSDYMMEVQMEVSTTTPGFIFVAPSTDLSQAPSIRAIIEETPVDQTITSDAFIPVRDQLRKLSFGWSVYQSLELLKVIPENIADPSNNQPSRLFLATTFFRCERIQDPISYPEILTHPGTSSYVTCAGVLKPDEKRLFEDFRQEFWNRNKNRVSFHEPAARAAQHIIEMCSLDPAVTTAKDMDALNPFIGCASCRNPNNPLNDTLIMTWRRAILHLLEHKTQNTVPLWVLLHANIQADWYNEALSSVQKEGPIYRCHLCTEYGDSSFIWAHFASRHRHLIPRRLHLLADPPSAFWVPSPITNALGTLGRCFRF